MLLGLVLERFPFINVVFTSIHDPRDRERILYSVSTLLWTLVLGFFTRSGSRNRMDADRNDEFYAKLIMDFSRQDTWPADSPLTTACSETACGFLENVEPAILEALLVKIVQHLIQAKELDWARFKGYFFIAVDGTKQENCRAGHMVDGKSRRMVLEAKLIGPGGFCLPLFTEPMDQYDDERGKHDCEQRAFNRLAPRIKAAFPKLPICLLGDALYANETVFDICERNGWKYILVFKETSHPAVAVEVESLIALQSENTVSVSDTNSTTSLKWAEAVPFPKRNLTVLCCRETGKTPYDGKWATNFEIVNGEDALHISEYGRRRWNIESSFHVQKHGGFGLEHTFCTSDKQAANMHLLMQLAHLLWQVLYGGILRRIFRKCRKLPQMTLVSLIRNAMHHFDVTRPVARFQLRFSSA